MQFADLVATFTEKGMHVFTFNDAVGVLGKRRSYVKLLLSRMVSRNAIHRVERGIYCTESAGVLETASNIVQPSYVSLMAALSYYGVTTQVPILIDVITSKRHRPVNA